MDEAKLFDLANSDPNFIRVLKSVDSIDGLIEFMKKKSVIITYDEASKLLEALHYFSFDKEGKFAVDSSSLDNVTGGVSSSNNPFLGILQKLV